MEQTLFVDVVKVWVSQAKISEIMELSKFLQTHINTALSEKKILEIRNSEGRLAATRHVHNVTGWGLKDSLIYVDSL